MEHRSLAGVNLLHDLFVSKSVITAQLHNKKAFEIPLESIQSYNYLNNELVLGLAGEAEEGRDCLTEVRFFQQPSKENQRSQLERVEAALGNRIPDEDSNRICTLIDLPFVVPRGKYSADVSTDGFLFHGSSYSFHSSFANVAKCFCLEMPDKLTVCFVLGFEKPPRQGQTVYRYAVLQFRIDTHIRVEAREGYGLPPTLHGPYFEIFATILRRVGRINLVIPSEFRASPNDTAIACLHGPRQGHIFILQKSLLFVTKPVVHVRFEHIGKTELHRVTAKSKAFDLEVTTVAGASYLFGGIEKALLDKLIALFRSHGVPVAVAEEEYEPKDDLNDYLPSSDEEEAAKPGAVEVDSSVEAKAATRIA